jgi:hypothetical protein
MMSHSCVILAFAFSLLSTLDFAAEFLSLTMYLVSPRVIGDANTGKARVIAASAAVKKRIAQEFEVRLALR